MHRTTPTCPAEPGRGTWRAIREVGSVRLGGEGGGARRNRLYTRHGPRPGLRTVNMPLMVVTLDVSKLSGWLNADASCRVERRAYDAGRGAGRERGRWAAAARERHARGEGPAVKAGGARACAERTENMPYMVVTLDMSRLSGWLNALAP